MPQNHHKAGAGATCPRSRQLSEDCDPRAALLDVAPRPDMGSGLTYPLSAADHHRPTAMIWVSDMPVWNA